MIEIIVIIALGLWLTNTAKKFNKTNPWVYGLLAALTYIVIGYGSAILIILAVLANGETNEGSLILYGLLGIPFGVGAVVILRAILKKNWEAGLKSESQDQLLDDTSSEL